MGRMPARMYRRITQKAYTRREYIGGVPGVRITQFELGDKHGEFPAVINLVALERCQIRHTALESARISSNRVLAKKCGSLGYHILIRPYPHHILRHNKQAAGAGADRISSGMRNAFGRPVGTAARVETGQILITIRTSWGFLGVAREALRRARMKLPTPARIVIVGEIPKNLEELARTAKAVGIIEEEKKEEKPAEGEAAAAEGAEGAPEGAEAKEGEKGDKKPAPGDKKAPPGAKAPAGKPAAPPAGKGPEKGAEKKAGGKPGKK